MASIQKENTVDYALTARLATEAFADGTVKFSPDRIRWLYERGFGQGSTVLAAIENGRKVGQVALIGQKLCVAGETFPAVQLVDLFIMQAYRSSGLVRELYREVERICEMRGIRYILTLPNDKSAPLNARLLKLRPLIELPVRAGLSLLSPRARLAWSGSIKSLSREAAVAQLSRFACPLHQTGIHYDGESLFDRLDDPTRDYAIHATDELLLVSTRRRRKGMSYTVLCAFFARPGTEAAPREVDDLVRAACRHWASPAFVYAGLNDSLPKLPGVPLPARVRRPILVQFRDRAKETPDLRFGRFQLIDSDFA